MVNIINENDGIVLLRIKITIKRSKIYLGYQYLHVLLFSKLVLLFPLFILMPPNDRILSASTISPTDPDLAHQVS
jgi:hypothetical protein